MYWRARSCLISSSFPSCPPRKPPAYYGSMVSPQRMRTEDPENRVTRGSCVYARRVRHSNATTLRACHRGRGIVWRTENKLCRRDGSFCGSTLEPQLEVDTACSPRISAPASVCTEVRERLHTRSYRRITNCDQTQQLGTYVSSRGNQQQHDNTSAPGTRCSHAFELHCCRHFPPQLRPSAARGCVSRQANLGTHTFQSIQAEKREGEGEREKRTKKAGTWFTHTKHHHHHPHHHPPAPPFSMQTSSFLAEVTVTSSSPLSFVSLRASRYFTTNRRSLSLANL